MNPLKLNWGVIGKSAAGWASGFNWYKYAAYALVLSTLIGVIHVRATHRAELACEKQKTALAEKKTKDIIDFTNVQSGYSQLREKKSQAIREIVYVSGDKLYEAITQRTDDISCDLSDSEFLRLNELAKATR